MKNKIKPEDSMMGKNENSEAEEEIVGGTGYRIKTRTELKLHNKFIDAKEECKLYKELVASLNPMIQLFTKYPELPDALFYSNSSKIKEFIKNYFNQQKNYEKK